MSSSVPCDVQVGCNTVTTSCGANTSVDASPSVRKPARVPSSADNCFKRSNTGTISSLTTAAGTVFSRDGRPTSTNPHEKLNTAIHTNKRLDRVLCQSETVITNAASI